MSREAFSVFQKTFNKIDKKTVVGPNSVTLWLQDHLTTTPTCHSCCRIFSSTLSKTSDKHLLPNRSKTGASAGRKYIITRQWPCIVPHPVYLHKLIQVEEVIYSVQTQQSGFVAIVLATLWKRDLSCKTTIQEACNAFYWCTDLKNSYWPSFISDFICCVGSLSHTTLNSGVDCCLKVCVSLWCFQEVKWHFPHLYSPCASFELRLTMSGLNLDNKLIKH